MHSQAADTGLAELLYGPAAEAQASDKKSYYWDIWHKHGNWAWARRGQTKPALYTRVGSSNRHVEVWRNCVERLGLAGGWLYITRNVWDGTRWVVEQCNLYDILKKQFHPCKKK